MRADLYGEHTMKLMRLTALAAALALAASACDGDDSGAGSAGADTTVADTGSVDGAATDAGGLGDSNGPDGGPGEDGSAGPDATLPDGAGSDVTGADSGADSGAGADVTDVGAGDVGAPDDTTTPIDSAGTDGAGGGGPFDCCSDDAPCEQGLVCAPLPTGGPGGVCEPPATDGCWSNADCAAGEACEGVSVCACTADCAEADSPGTCVTATPPPGCCNTDADCLVGDSTEWSCAMIDGAGPGTCVPDYGAGTCWDDADCGSGEHCKGATFCPCGFECAQIEAPGSCVPTTQLLCSGWCSDEGMTCVGDIEPPFDGENAMGQCRKLPNNGLCWEDSDCNDGMVCVGAVWCQAGHACLATEHTGRCLEPVPAGGGTCWADVDCGDGEACVGAFVPLAPSGGVTPDTPIPGVCCATPAGACWQHSNCPVGEHCEGASLPLPDACADSLSGAAAGTCTPNGPWPEELCLSDDTCGGATCIGEWTCPPGAHCLDGPYRGLCLTPPASDCREAVDCGGAPCDGAWICDVLDGEMCGGAMATPGTCGSLAAGDVCLQGGGCGTGLSCCYPCGIQGCPWTCTPSCAPGDPECSGGCPTGVP